MSEPAKVLVIDDDEIVRTSISTTLRNAGYEVETAENGVKAIAKSESGFYNLALIDIRLPDIEGTELLKKLKETTPKMVKIIVTGYPSLQNAVDAVNKGADGYIIKPAKMDELLRTIREHLAKQQNAEHFTEEKIKEFVETTEKIRRGHIELSERLTLNEVKGEVSILEQRHAVVDIRALLNHLDALVGSQVAEVIARSLEMKLGKEDALRIHQVNPDANVAEIIERLIESDRYSGFGLTNVILTKDNPNQIHVETANPCLKGTAGAARVFHFAWWAGVLSGLLNREFEIGDVAYDEARNLVRCDLAPRLSNAAPRNQTEQK